MSSPSIETYNPADLTSNNCVEAILFELFVTKARGTEKRLE